MADNGADIFVNADVWLHIATFLSNHDLTHGLAGTCRFLYAVANDPFVWASIVCSPCGYDELECLARKHPSIRHIEVVGSHADADRESELLLTALPDLQTVRGLKVPWAGDHGRPLTHASCYNGAIGAAPGSLRSLEVSEVTSWSPGGFVREQLDNSLIYSASSITALRLTFVGEGFFEVLAPQFPALVELRLSGVRATFAGWCVFTASHTKLQRLEFLDAHVCVNPDTETVAAAAACLPSSFIPGQGAEGGEGAALLTSLLELSYTTTHGSLCAWYLRDKLMPGLIEASALSLTSVDTELSKCTALTRLKLPKQATTPTDRPFLEALAKQVKLRYGCGKYVPELLPALDRVRELDCNWVRKPVARAISGSACYLRELSISRASEVTLAFAEVVGQGARLRKLSIACEATHCEEGVEEALAQGCFQLVSLTLKCFNSWTHVAAAAGRGGQLEDVFLEDALSAVALVTALPGGYRLTRLSLGGYACDLRVADALLLFYSRGGSIVSLSGVTAADIDAIPSLAALSACRVIKVRDPGALASPQAPFPFRFGVIEDDQEETEQQEEDDSDDNDSDDGQGSTSHTAVDGNDAHSSDDSDSQVTTSSPVDAASILNTDVWIRVAAFLTNHDLTHGLALVCRFLYAIACNPFVWSSITVTPCCLAELDRLAERFPSIRFLDGEFCEGVYKHAALSERVLAALPHLASVSGFRVVWKEDHGKPLLATGSHEELMGTTGSAIVIAIEGEHSVWGRGVPAALYTPELCGRHTSVTTVSLWCCTDDYVHVVASAFPRLENFLVYNSRVTGDAWASLVASHPNMRYLELQDSCISQPTIASYGELFHSSLSSVRASTHIRPDGGDADAFEWYTGQFIPGLVRANKHSLVSLFLHVDNNSWEIYDAVAECTALTSLELLGTVPVGLDSIASLAKKVSLRHVSGGFLPPLLPALRSVDSLSYKWVREDVVVSIGAGLTALQSLTLNHSSSLSTVAAAIIGEHARLKSLSLYENFELEEGVDEALAPACQQLSSLNLYAVQLPLVAAAAARGGYLREVTLHTKVPSTVTAFFSNLPRGFRLEVFGINGPRKVEGDAVGIALREWLDSGGSVALFSSDVRRLEPMLEGRCMSVCGLEFGVSGGVWS